MSKGSDRTNTSQGKIKTEVSFREIWLSMKGKTHNNF